MRRLEFGEMFPDCENHFDGEIIETCPTCGEPLKAWVRVKKADDTLLPCAKRCRCDDEVERRERDRKLLEALRAARVPVIFENVTVEETMFDPTISDGWSLYLYGPVRTGKTRAACALARKAVESGMSVRFTMTSEIAEHEFSDRDGGRAFMEALRSVDLLIVDDLGKAETSEWAVSKLFALVNARYSGGKPVIVTTNFQLGQLARELAKKAPASTAEAIARRLMDMCRPHQFGNQRMRM